MFEQVKKLHLFELKKDAKEKSGGKMTLSQNLKKCLGKDLETPMHDGGLIICQLHTIHVNILRYKTSHSIFRLNNR